jgi:hypothetical protein
MPLIKQVLQTQIFQALQKLTSAQQASPTGQLEFAKDLATAIDAYIKSATIIIPPGQQSAGQNAPGQLVVGASPSGPVTGATTSPGVVSTTTIAPSPNALIS